MPSPLWDSGTCCSTPAGSLQRATTRNCSFWPSKTFTRSIRGWHLGRSLDQGLTLAALERALLVAVPQLHHSDQGLQYAATAYVERLRQLDVTPSMAAVGEPRENGYAERLLRTIKEEEVDLSDYRDLEDARQQIGHFLDAVYNVKRIHSSLGYLTPREARTPRWSDPTRSHVPKFWRGVS